MKVVAIIQARMGSTRLPGKVMMNLDCAPVLAWCVRAARAAPGVDEVWVATSTEPADNVIQAFCLAGDIRCYRGSQDDVLARFMNCTVEAGATDGGDIILRLTGDCPFLDPRVIGGVIRLMKQTGAAYCTNISPRTYPDGLDVQAMTYDALLCANGEATRPLDRDGVCTWIERNRSRFPSETLINPIPGMQDERWVLDTEADLNFCECIAECWPWVKGPPSMLDIAGILDKYPTFRSINSAGVMNERYFAALAEEEVYPRSFERSQAQLAKAEAVIPLGAQTFSKSRLQYAAPSPLFLSHGDGALVWDIDGNEYVDLVSALLPNILGYRDPDVDVAIRRQLGAGISFSLATELETQLAETIRRLVPCAEAARFGKTGTDATTAAVRLARAFTGRDKILICGGYHGWADWSVERNLGVPVEVQRLTYRIPLSDPEPLLTLVGSSQCAAVIVEPESQHLLQELRDLCTKTGTVLIFDEVITGFRFDLGGAQKLFGVTPDLACFGKAMANGMPLSAIVGKKSIMAKFAPPDNIFYSGTMFGEALSLAAGIATIAKLERDNIIPQLWNVGGLLADEAQKLVEAYALETMITQSGQWPVVQLKFRDEQLAALFRREMVNSGTLITNRHNISAAHGPNEIRRILKSYDHALGFVAEAIMEDKVEERLAGATITQGVRV